MDKLINFLIKAKNNTYANGLGKVESSRKHSSDMKFVEKEFEYLDSYFGSNDFSGQEIIYKDNVPIWSMVYYGKILDVSHRTDIVFLLKESLKLVDEKQPYRGPKKNIINKKKYVCNVDGDISFFKGIEKIIIDNREVYKLYFSGGKID